MFSRKNITTKALSCLAGLMVLIPATRASDILHVDASRPDDTGPGTEWANAFQTIQAAVNAASPGDTILVTNGIYDKGGEVFASDLLTNRVSIWQAVHVTAVSTNPADTVIAGAPDQDSGLHGDSAVRGVYLAAGATLTGFTITNGHTRTATGTIGGGIQAENATAIVSNCLITGNNAVYRGGGAYGGTYYNCIIRGNRVTTSGVNHRGGGASHATLHQCLIEDNFTAGRGGGIAYIQHSIRMRVLP